MRDVRGEGNLCERSPGGGWETGPRGVGHERALGRGVSGGLGLSLPRACSADSQSDAEASAGGEVLDLTSREREPPTPEGAAEPSRVPDESAAEEAEPAAATPLAGEERGTEEDAEPEEERAEGEWDEDADSPAEDTVSNKSLDLNLASKLMGFKLAEGEAGAGGSGDPAAQDHRHARHACHVCGKSFKFLGTLNRHRKAHGREEPGDRSAAPQEPEAPPPTALELPQRPAEPPATEPPAQAEAVTEAPAEKQSDEAEGPSDGDGEGLAERKPSEKSEDDKKPKTDSPRSVASKADKRKKVCSVCSKRFWSLQDLTRHMRSHTGEGGGGGGRAAGGGCGAGGGGGEPARIPSSSHRGQQGFLAEQGESPGGLGILRACPTLSTRRAQVQWTAEWCLPARFDRPLSLLSLRSPVSRMGMMAALPGRSI